MSEQHQDGAGTWKCPDCGVTGLGEGHAPSCKIKDYPFGPQPYAFHRDPGKPHYAIVVAASVLTADIALVRKVVTRKHDVVTVSYPSVPDGPEQVYSIPASFELLYGTEDQMVEEFRMKLRHAVKVLDELPDDADVKEGKCGKYGVELPLGALPVNVFAGIKQ